MILQQLWRHGCSLIPRLQWKPEDHHDAEHKRLWHESDVDSFSLVSAVLVKHYFIFFLCQLRFAIFLCLERNKWAHMEIVWDGRLVLQVPLFFLLALICRWSKGAAHSLWCWKFVLCANDRLNQTIKRYFRFYWSHEKYPLIVRLCPSRNSVSCTTSSSSSSSQLCNTLGFAQVLWGVWLVPIKSCWHPVVSFTKKPVLNICLIISLFKKTKQRRREFCWCHN